jgi:transcription antitermination factor NusG
MSNSLKSLLVRPQKQSEIKKTSSKKFIQHGTNVMIVNGNYKGYYAFVKEFLPSKYETDLFEESFVLAHIYGERNINDTILTPFGKAVIIEKVPQLISIKTFKNELIIPASDLIYEFSFNVNNKLTSGIKINSLYDIDHVIKTESGETINLKNSDVIKKLLRVISGTFVGESGDYIRTIDEQYKIQYSKKVFLSNNSFDITQNKDIIVTKGVHKNQKGTIIKKIPESLILFINSTGKQIFTHYITKNGVYLNKPIYNDDVFFMDAVLTNGNDAEIQEIYNDDTFKIIENTSAGFKEKIISENDIQTRSPGFEILSFAPIYSDKLSETVLFDSNSDSDSDTDSENGEEDSEEDNEDEDNLVNSNLETEENTAKTTFRDLERTEIVFTDMTADDKTYMAYITKLVNVFKISGDNMDTYDILASVKAVKSRLDTEMKNQGINEQIPSDIKYIVAILFLHFAIRNGFNSKITLLSITNVLTNNKFFVPKDIKRTIFLNENIVELSETEKTNIQSLFEKQEYNSIIALMIRKADEKIQSYTGKLYTDTIVFEEKLIPLGLKRKNVEPEIITTSEYNIKDQKGNEYTMKKTGAFYPDFEAPSFITIPELLENNIPEIEKSILWGNNYTSVLEKYITIIKEKQSNTQDPISKDVYQFIINNLHRAPFALKETGSTTVEYKQLDKIYKQLLLVLSQKHDLIKAQRQELVYENLDRKNERDNKRTTARSDKITSDFDDLKL